MTFVTPLRILSSSLGIVLALSSASACVIESDDDDGASSSDGGGSDDDDSGGSASGSSASGGTSSTSGGGETSTSGVDDGSDGTPGTTTNASGGAVEPESGNWLYAETGRGTSDCTFIGTPTNGFGEYLIEVLDATAFQITPGDATEPFDCELDGGAYHCPERLVDTVAAGNVSGEVIVEINGAFDSSTFMTGSQDGRIECVGSEADCAAAEVFLETTFPCEFSVPFEGTKL